MRGLFKRLPKELPLHKSDERKITSLLSSLPRIEPEVEIAPLPADFEVTVLDHPDYLAQLEIGAEAFYSEYDARGSHGFLEASFVKVARKVKAEGAWCLEVYETGGADLEGRFSLCWDLVYHSRLKLPPCFARDAAVKVVDEVTFEGPAEERCHFAGYAMVTVGGVAQKCMKLIHPYQYGEKPGSLWMDVLYVTDAGRIALRRRYRSLEDYSEWIEWLNERGYRGPDDVEPVDDFAASRDRLTYNGQGFYHWFDSLTDLALGRLIAPEWAPVRKKRKGRRILSWL